MSAFTGSNVANYLAIKILIATCNRCYILRLKSTFNVTAVVVYKSQLEPYRG